MEHARTDEGRKQLRYAGVSIIFVPLLLIAQMLEGDGHSVVAVESGEAALEALASADFDLVFLDFNMHDIDGASVYEAYRFGRLNPAPTYFVTADTSALTATPSEFSTRLMPCMSQVR